jgi:23S rRNA pseudouridine2605 synthase
MAKKKSKSAASKPASKPKTKPSQPKTGKRKSAVSDNPNVQRLQRAMASAGVGSRRDCEEIILAGRVEVDGQVVSRLGTKVDITTQTITVDAVNVRTETLQYFILNKPPGVVSTSNDPSGRMRVIDLINTRNRVYNVGRLDKSSEGLILVTNDGDLANKLTHPKYGVEKKYHVQVVGHPNPESLKALTQGVYLAEGRAKASAVKYLKRAKESSWIEITLTEGRNREIRRLLAKIGHKVRVLRRVSIGSLKLGDLPSGAHRELTRYELKALQRIDKDKRKPRQKKIKPRDLAEVKEQAKVPFGKNAKTAKKKKSKRTAEPKRPKSSTRGDSGRGAARAKPTGKPMKKKKRGGKRR